MSNAAAICTTNKLNLSITSKIHMLTQAANLDLNVFRYVVGPKSMIAATDQTVTLGYLLGLCHIDFYISTIAAYFQGLVSVNVLS